MSSFVVNTIQDLKSLSNVSLNDYATVLGYFSVGDGRGGAFYFDANDNTSVTVEGLLVIPNIGSGRWKRIVNTKEYRIAWFDVSTNGTDQTAKANYIVGLPEIKTLVFDFDGDITINGTGANKLIVPTSKTLVFQNGCRLVGAGQISAAASREKKQKKYLVQTFR